MSGGTNWWNVVGAGFFRCHEVPTIDPSFLLCRLPVASNALKSTLTTSDSKRDDIDFDRSVACRREKGRHQILIGSMRTTKEMPSNFDRWSANKKRDAINYIVFRMEDDTFRIMNHVFFSFSGLRLQVEWDIYMMRSCHVSCFPVGNCACVGLHIFLYMHLFYFILRDYEYAFMVLIKYFDRVSPKH